MIKNYNKITERSKLISLPNTADKVIVNIKTVPNNFVNLFRYVIHKCNCHDSHLNITTVLDHYNINVEEFMKNFVLKLKCKEKCLLYKRKQNEKYIDKILNHTNGLYTK